MLILATFFLVAQTQNVAAQDEVQEVSYELQDYPKTKKAAIITTLLTGLVGGHRIYLGTSPIVPIVYTITLGGGLGILPLIDLFHIIFTKKEDFEELINRKEVFLLTHRD